MKKLITIIAILISTVSYSQKVIDIPVRYEGGDYHVMYVIDTTKHTDKEWIAIVNIYKDGNPVWVGQRGLYDKNRRYARQSKFEVELIRTAITRKRATQ